MKPAKRFLIILFVIQLVFPSALAISGAMSRSNFNKKAAEYKVRLESVNYYRNESSNVYVDFLNLRFLSYLTDEDKYVIFEETENGFYEPKATAKMPENNAYINIEGGLKSYEYKGAKVNAFDVMYEESVCFYSKVIEASNLAMKLIGGEPTEAYAVIKVFENKIEITAVYINGIEFSEYLEKYYNGEIDVSRYDNSLS